MNRKISQQLVDLISEKLEGFRRFEDGLRVDTHATSIWSKAIKSSDAEAFAKITKKVAELPELVAIGPRAMHHGMTATQLRDETISEWLVWRSTQVGAELAVQNLISFLASDRYTALQVSVLGGIRVDGKYQLDHNSDLIPYDELESDIMKFQFQKRMKDMLLFGPEIRPGAAIVTRYVHPTVLSGIEVEDIIQVSKSVDDPHRMVEYEHMRRVQVIRNMITLVGPSCPIVLGSWESTDYSVPYLAGGFSSRIGPSFKYYRKYWEFTEKEVLELKDLLKLYDSLHEKEQNLISLATGYLHNAMKLFHSPTSAVSIGTALESIFLSDQRSGELRYRLALRLSRALGTSFKERSELFQDAKAIYDLRSKAVHTGSVKSRKSNGKQLAELFEKGYSLLARAVKWRLSNPIVDWKSIELS